MFDVNDDAKGGFRRFEVLTGSGRRRRWSDEEKGQIVSETLEAGARVVVVARRWQVCPQRVFGWRHHAQQTEPAEPCAVQTCDFVAVISRPAPAVAPARKQVVAPVIEVRLAEAVVLANIAQQPVSRLDDLLPWNWHPQNTLTRQAA